MSNWEETRVDLGIVREKSRVEFVYKATKPLNIVKVSAGCGSCTKIGKFNSETLELPITYRASSIPKHLLNQGTQELAKVKSVRVKFKDGTEDVLTFVVKIVKR